MNKIAVFDFGDVLFLPSAKKFYADLFNRAGRNEQELEYFLANVFTGAHRAEGNYGTIGAIIERQAKLHPEWAEEIRAFGPDRDFIRQIHGTMPGMEQVLADLQKAGIGIYGLTNWAADTFPVLDAAYPQITGKFNKIVVSGTLGIKKPMASIFTHAQAAFGNPDPKNVYYFDDKAPNIEAARKVVGWNGFVFQDAGTVRAALSI